MELKANKWKKSQFDGVLFNWLMNFFNFPKDRLLWRAILCNPFWPSAQTPHEQWGSPQAGLLGYQHDDYPSERLSGCGLTLSSRELEVGSAPPLVKDRSTELFWYSQWLKDIPFSFNFWLIEPTSKPHSHSFPDPDQLRFGFHPLKDLFVMLKIHAHNIAGFTFQTFRSCSRMEL
jgi:hypothetical protein